MKIVSEVVTVMDKSTNVGTDGKTYFNIKVGGMGFSNVLGVPESLYNAVEIGSDVRLSGSVGFTRAKEGKPSQRFWFFDELYLGK